MNLHLRSLASSVVFGVLAVASIANATSPAAIQCRSGYGGGAFDLPYAYNQNGTIDGYLSHGITGQVAYHLSGVLVFVPTPCLSCVEGKIDATLDDGIGTGPDYIVRGRYIGGWMSGEGQFTASVHALGSNVRVGRITGNFNDPPSSSQPGSFSGTWRICD